MSGSRLSAWPTLPPRPYLRPPRDPLPFPLDRDDSRIFARGRHALLHGARSLGLGSGDEVLVPAYHHGSEVEALIRTGARPRFYDCDEGLEPREDQLGALLGPRVKALHLTHYLGFPQDSARWRNWCDDRGLLLIEDAAQAWLSSRDGLPVGSLADLAVYCLYKTVGLPEGAALVSTHPPPQPRLDPRIGVVPIARRHGVWLAERSAVAHLLSLPLQGREAVSVEEEIDVGDTDAGVWRAVPWLLPRLVERRVPAQRRANFRILLEALADRVPPPFDELPPGASPFVFPIDAADKEVVLDRLRDRGVRALDLWAERHPSLPSTGFPDAERRRRRTVGLPVHQELGLGDLERIALAAGARPARDRRLRLEPLDGFGSAAGEWSTLAARADNVFATPEWLATWWRHFGNDAPVVLGAYRGDALVGIVPLYRTTLGPLRALRFAGHGPSDQLGPICAPADAAGVAGALREGLRSGLLGDWDALVGDTLLESQGWSTLLAGQVVRTESSPVVSGRRTFEQLLASRSANFRQQVHRRERKLRREHGLRFRLCEDPARLQADLGLLFDLHARRWGPGESTAFDGRRAAFHRDFAALALERGWLRLWVAEADGRPVATLYGWRFGDSECFYQSGRDPAWAREAVGFVLLAHAVGAALDDGVAEYRLLRGAEAYKRRFADHDPGLETMIVPRRSVTGAAAAVVAALAERERPRRWLGRLAASTSP